AELKAGSASARNEDPGRRVGRAGLPSASTGRGTRASADAGGEAGREAAGGVGVAAPSGEIAVGLRGRLPAVPPPAPAEGDGEAGSLAPDPTKGADGAGSPSFLWTGS